MTAPAALARIIDAVERGQPLDPADAAALLAGLRAGSLDRALGITPTSQRDQLIRDGIARFLNHESAPADKFKERLAQFASTAWSRERDLPECPRRHLGKLEEVLWRILKLRDRVLCARQIRRILDV